MTDGQALPMGWGFDIEDNASDKMTGIKSGLLSLFTLSKKIEQETDSSPKGTGLFSFLRNLKKDKPSDEFKESNRIMGKMKETGGKVADRAKWTLKSILGWGIAIAAAYLGLKGMSEMIDDIWESGKKVETVFTRMSLTFRSQKEASKYRKWMHEAMISYPITEEELQAVGDRFGRMRESIEGFNIRGIIGAAATEIQDFNSVFEQMASIAEGSEGAEGVHNFFKEFRDVPKKEVEELAGHFSFLTLGATSFRERLEKLSGTLNKYYGDVTNELGDQLPVRLSILSRLMDNFREKIIGDPVKGTLFYDIRKTISDIVDFFEDSDVVSKMENVATGISIFLRSAWSVVDRWVKFGMSQLKNLLHVSDMTGAQFMNNIIMPFIAWTTIAFEKARLKLKGIFVGIRDWWREDGQEMKAGMADFWGIMKPILEYVVKNPDQLAIAIITSKVLGLVTALGAFSKIAKGGAAAGMLKWLGMPLATGATLLTLGQQFYTEEGRDEALADYKVRTNKFLEQAREYYKTASEEEKFLMRKTFYREASPGHTSTSIRGTVRNLITGQSDLGTVSQKTAQGELLSKNGPGILLPYLKYGDDAPDFESVFKAQVTATEKAKELIEELKGPNTGIRELIESLKNLNFPTGVTPNINVNLNVDGKRLHEVMVPYMEFKARTETKR